MSPMVNGYSVYVGGVEGDWTVRVYRDADDHHVHTAEGIATLKQAFDVAHWAITWDRECVA